MTTELEQTLRLVIVRQERIEARHEIEGVLARYARGIDRLDLDLLKTVFHPDAINHGYGGADQNAHDWCDEVIPTLRSLFGATMHHITHKSIEIAGESAASESYFISWHLVTGGRAEVVRFFGQRYAAECAAAGRLEAGHEYIGGGRYLHRWEKRDGAWRIIERTATLEWNHFYPSSHGEPGSLMATIEPFERRDRTDPVYALFAAIKAKAE